MREATWNQCVQLSIIWFGTTQLAYIVSLLGMDAKSASFIIEHDEWCRRKP